LVQVELLVPVCFQSAESPSLLDRSVAASAVKMFLV
jgi:hypothetical protein